MTFKYKFVSLSYCKPLYVCVPFFREFRELNETAKLRGVNIMCWNCAA